MTTKRKFPKRVVLGEGYPWNDNGGSMSDIYKKTVALYPTTNGGTPIELDYPPELEGEVIPKYRLILERVEVKCGRKRIR